MSRKGAGEDLFVIGHFCEDQNTSSVLSTHFAEVHPLIVKRFA